jgi:hypothetical protein
VDLQSEVGVGTTVTVRFPAERIAHSPHRPCQTNANQVEFVIPGFR